MLNMVNPHDDNHDGAEDETARHIQWTNRQKMDW